MSRLWWTIRLSLVLRYSFGGSFGHSSLVDAWTDARSQCWRQYRHAGYSPYQAANEVLSCT